MTDQVQDTTYETPVASSEPDYSNDTTNGESIAALLNSAPEVVEVETPEEVEETPKITSESEKYKVKIAGEEKEVTLEELKNGYQRQSDYTNKTQELSQERKQIESKKGEYEQYLSSIPMLFSTAEANIKTAQEHLFSPDFINLASTDPAEYIAQKAQLEASVQQNQQFMSNAKTQYEQHQNEIAQQNSQAFQADLAKSNEILVKEFGEDWKNGTLQKTLLDYGVKNGFDATALNNVNDHKVIHMMNKARLYDEMVANKDVNQKQVKKIPPKVISPSSNNTESSTDLANLRKQALRSNNSDDLGKLISKYL